MNIFIGSLLILGAAFLYFEFPNSRNTSAFLLPVIMTVMGIMILVNG